MKIKKVVIPTAGLATRMFPATKGVPKAMLPIFDKPTLQYVIEEVVEVTERVKGDFKGLLKAILAAL